MSELCYIGASREKCHFDVQQWSKATTFFCSFSLPFSFLADTGESLIQLWFLLDQVLNLRYWRIADSVCFLLYQLLNIRSRGLQKTELVTEPKQAGKWLIQLDTKLQLTNMPKPYILYSTNWFRLSTHSPAQLIVLSFTCELPQISWNYKKLVPNERSVKFERICERVVPIWWAISSCSSNGSIS